MALFNRNKSKNQTQTPRYHDADFLNEYAKSSGIDFSTFVQGVHRLDTNYINNDLLLDRMCEDSIISSAISMWIEDTLQRDPSTKEIFHVELNVPKDNLEDKLSKGLAEELDNFLKKDLKMEENLPNILYRVIKYGQSPIKLDFADALDDAQLELKESNKLNFAQTSVKLQEMFGDLSTSDSIDSIRRRLDEKVRTNYLVDNEALCENYYEFPVYALSEKGLLKEASEITAKNLNEDDLKSIKRMIKGRWYFDLIGHGTNIYSLTAKQKLIAYLDRDNLQKFIKPNRIVNFTNNTGKHKVQFEIGGQTDQPSSKKYYQLERGESFLENSMVAWQVLSALEDILLLTRMTRSILYRIFSVEVGNKGNNEVYKLLENLKNKIKMDETVDVRNKIYNSSLAQVPLGDSIFIPTRNGVGVIDVKTVGGDVNLKDAIDLDYFKDKLFAGLRIPKAYFGFGEDTSGMMNQSLTQMDIRYCRTIVRLQSILSAGLKDLCNLYLDLTRTKKARPELPDFKVVFTSPTSAEDESRAQVKQTLLETLQRTLENLSTLGITFTDDTYTNTREELIKEYFGSTLLETIKEDERIQPAVKPTEDDKKPDIPSSPSRGMLSGPSIDVDVNNEEPSDTEEPGENVESPEEIETPDTDLNPPSEEDFELG